MFRSLALFIALFAVSSFGFLSTRIHVSSTGLFSALKSDDCEARLKDKNGRCPGDTGYVSFTKDNIPKDFAAFAAEQKAKKAAEAAKKAAK